MFVPLTDVTFQPGLRRSSRAEELFALSAPQVPQVHFFDTEHGQHLLVANGSRIYGVESADMTRLHAALSKAALNTADSPLVDNELQRLGLDAPLYVDSTPPNTPPVRALSLAVAQKCNLGCTYCYAQEGGFGSAPRDMPLETALGAVDLLFSEARAGERVNLAFLGGEPLSNRKVLHAATERAVQVAGETGVIVTFSITTNGTLLGLEDAEFFERYGFAVTVSLDGIGAVHNELRPFKSGRGSYEKIIERVQPLLAMQRRMQVSARVTVTPRNPGLLETLNEFIRLGFHSIGFSPLLSSPTGRDEMSAPELEAMLEAMVECGEEFERHIQAGQRYPFLNMMNAMREIHHGTHRPYACGAGAGYLGVSAEGDLAACHRFVGDEAGAMGDLKDGVNRTRQAKWLSERHVHRQEPCGSCWARYLCGGGCHHEVIHRGRPACDYIRGWLHYCLQAYVRLTEARPEYFGSDPKANG